MLTFVAFLFVFGIVVFAHELGHFFLAKAVGVRVDEFGLGFGKRLVSYKYGETLYSLNLVPLGGFVRLAGMDGDEDNMAPDSFNAKKVWQRIAVIASGPLMNFVLALLLIFLVFFFYGMPSPSKFTVIGEVMPGQPAANIGLKAGEQIIAVNGSKVNSWAELVDCIAKNPNQKIKLKILQTDSVQVEKEIIPVYDQEMKKGMIGIKPKIVYQQIGFWQSLKIACLQTFGVTAAILVSLFQMITGQLSGDVAGPIGIAQMAGQAARVGFEKVLQLTAILSINLGLFNLLPIPALDGGRLFFLFIEGIRGKAIDPKKEGLVHFAGFIILMLILLLVTYKDILRLF